MVVLGVHKKDYSQEPINIGEWNIHDDVVHDRCSKNEN